MFINKKIYEKIDKVETFTIINTLLLLFIDILYLMIIYIIIKN